MKVTVKLIGPLIYEAGFSEKELALHGTMTVAELAAHLKIDKKRTTIITRNGKAAAPGEALKNGDRVAISPLYSGG